MPIELTVTADEVETLESLVYELRGRLDVDQEPGESPHPRPWPSAFQHVAVLDAILERASEAESINPPGA